MARGSTAEIAQDAPPITLQAVPLNGRILRFREPLTLQPSFDPDLRGFSVQLPELSIYAAGRTRQELLRDLYEDIHGVWDLFALRDDSNMTPGAKQVKQTALSLIEDISHADCQA